MPQYLIEREIAGAGKLSSADLQAITQKSCAILHDIGPEIQWIESYVVDDKIYCVYVSPDEEKIRQHAVQGDFPANRISEIRNIIGPEKLLLN